MIRSFKILLILCFTGIGAIAHSQSTDLARIEYTYFPQSNSDNSFRQFRTFVDFPVKLNDQGAYLVPGVEYQNINLDYEDPAVFNTSELENFQSFTFYIYGGYTLLHNIRLRNADLDNVYTINEANSFYGRTGLKFNIL